MAKAPAAVSFGCPVCDLKLETPVDFITMPVHAVGEVRISVRPGVLPEAVKAHLNSHLPSGPDGGLPIAV